MHVCSNACQVPGTSRCSIPILCSTHLTSAHVVWCHSLVQIRRPNNYDPDVAMMLGPTSADPTMDLTALDIVKTVVVDSPNKLFVGGLPCEWAEDQARCW